MIKTMGHEVTPRVMASMVIHAALQATNPDRWQDYWADHIDEPLTDRELVEVNKHIAEIRGQIRVLQGTPTRGEGEGDDS